MIDSRFTSFLKVVMLVLVPFAMVMALKECHDRQREAHSMNEDQDVLLHNGKVEIGQTQAGKPMASVSAMSLKPSSLKRIPDSLLAATSKDLKVKPRRMVAAIKTSSLATADIHAAITTDSIYDEADKEMQLANDALAKAHDSQTEMLQKEAAGEKVDFSILFVHAQDHLMTAISEKNLIEQIIELRKVVNTLTK